MFTSVSDAVVGGPRVPGVGDTRVNGYFAVIYYSGCTVVDLLFSKTFTSKVQYA